MKSEEMRREREAVGEQTAAGMEMSKRTANGKYPRAAGRFWFQLLQNFYKERVKDSGNLIWKSV
jgi:hypothetical protein